MIPDKAVTFKHVYIVTESIDGKGEEYSIAIRPRVEPLQRIVWESNGGRSRVVDFRKWSDLNINWEKYFSEEQIPKKFTVVDLDHKITYTLESLTVEDYNRKLKHIVAKNKAFNDDQEAQDFFLKSSFS